MGGGTGLALKSVQLIIRAVQLGCGVVILAIYTYILATLSNRKLGISNDVRAVEGISGFTCLYAIGALIFVCCFAGRTLPSFIGLLLDTAFIACYIYVAVANKHGAGSCSGTVTTPFGTGKASEKPKGSSGFTVLPTYRSACKLQTACLAVAIIAIFFFIFSALTTVAMARNHYRGKRNGPGGDSAYPDNQLPVHPQPNNHMSDSRESHNTESTAIGEHDETAFNKYDNHVGQDYNNNYGHHDYDNQGVGFPHPQGQGRQDGYGYIHYPEPEDHTPHNNQSGYRYSDGIYERT